MPAKIIVVGGGLGGLMTTIKIAEGGGLVDLFSVVPVKRSHSVCAQGGINAAKNTKGEGDSVEKHFDDTIFGGDFLANQELPKRMCETGPAIIDLLDRMGVMFNRTDEGNIDLRRFGGTLYHRTAFAGATTGQQMLYALDEQVRRAEAANQVKKYEHWEFLSAVLDEKRICRGITALNLQTMEVKAFRADAVVLATGGCGMIFGKSTNSTACTGSAAGAVFQHGAYYGNGEFIQVHPTAIPGEDKLRLMSESARGEGGRVWTYRNGKPWYFLEEWYPKYGNLVPRDVASRAIFKVVKEMGLGVEGEDVVYLDLSHIPTKKLNERLGGILEIYEKFIGDDPRKVPMKIFPAVHYSMGGLWIDTRHMTNIAGLFAVGEVDYQYHGANRLGANSLLSCLFGGMVAGPETLKYASGLSQSCDAAPNALFDSEEKKQKEINDRLLASDGVENPFKLHQEMGHIMTDHVTVIRRNKNLQIADLQIQKLLDRCKRIGLSDRSRFANPALPFARQLHNMLHLARAITLGALKRNESRGAHYKPDFPNRDDANFLKTTKAGFTSDGPRIEYEEIDTRWIMPRERKY
jgi:succinate dehydrogenase / fumarate reductase flavoprotein subunit